MFCNKYQIVKDFRGWSTDPLGQQTRIRGGQRVRKGGSVDPIQKKLYKRKKEIAETSSALIVKVKKMKTYDEGKHSDDGLPEINYDTQEKVISPKQETKKYPNAKTVFALFGKHPANWRINKTQLQAAENLFLERGIEQIIKALTYVRKNKEDKFCPTINSPYDLDSKWAKLIGFKKRQ